MDAEIKKKWLAALRSGEYRQTKGYLRRTDIDNVYPRFCCLGVLTDLFIKEHPNNSKWRNQKSVSCPILNGKSCGGIQLPLPVQRWASLNTYSPRAKNKKYLSTMNDGGMNFDQIADAIEESF